MVDSYILMIHSGMVRDVGGEVLAVSSTIRHGFCKQLSQSTTNDIELRLCENSRPNEDDSPIELVEIYIK